MHRLDAVRLRLAARPAQPFTFSRKPEAGNTDGLRVFPIKYATVNNKNQLSSKYQYVKNKKPQVFSRGSMLQRRSHDERPRFR